MAWRAWLPERALRPWQAAAIGAGLAGAATAVRLVAQGPLGRELPFITYFPALILAAAFGGATGGWTCLAVATVAAALWVLPVGVLAAWTIGAFWIAGALIVVVTAALSDSVRDLRSSRARLAETQSRLRTLVGELAHRNRNALFVIMSIVSQSARGAASAAEAERIINARLDAMLRAQDVVLGGEGGSASLRPLLERVLEPFQPERFDIAGTAEVRLEPDVAIGLGLLFHELATNALKYGALSAPAGRVRVAWTLQQERAHLVWRESGGPAVAASPLRKGFGGRLLEAALVPQGGRAERRFEPDGVICELHIPTPPEAAPAPAAPAPGELFAARGHAAVAEQGT